MVRMTRLTDRRRSAGNRTPRVWFAFGPQGPPSVRLRGPLSPLDPLLDMDPEPLSFPGPSHKCLGTCVDLPAPSRYPARRAAAKSQPGTGLPSGFADHFARGFASVFARRRAPLSGRIAANGMAPRPARTPICRHLCASSSSGHEVKLSTSTPPAITSPPIALGATAIASALATQRFPFPTAPVRQRSTSGRPRTGGRA
jgi:hypothetical protein